MTIDMPEGWLLGGQGSNCLSASLPGRVTCILQACNKVSNLPGESSQSSDIRDKMHAI